ncbi:MAG: 3-deoxy-manno-octulosonate cytidylyltransferase [Gammaproteobacteria bacterium]|nr:3-deoxy-manno-octulosonate cytidylyltransferase [Gammaproteobacteria bacterium]
MPFTVIIPARYASSRFPGKPLVDIAGMPLLQHVYRRACGSGARRVVIATDDLRIAVVARGFGAEVVMTSAEHPSGTDRIAEAVEALRFDAEHVVVNLQGDEPLMPAEVLHQVADLLARDDRAVMATVCERIREVRDIFDPNIVKVVMDGQGRALYFSRAPIPWARAAFAETPVTLPPAQPYFRHIGLYAFRAGFLRVYGGLAPTPLESLEALEQLRVLQHGYTIAVAETRVPTGFGVDTPADAERVRALIQGQGVV